MLFNTLVENHILFPAITETSPVFANINVNDITDTLTVVITSVNGMSAEAAGSVGYISIAASTALNTLQSPAAARSEPGDDLLDANGFDRAGIHQATGTRYGPDGYDAKGWDKNGLGRDGYNAKGYDKNGRDRAGLTGFERTFGRKWGFQIEPTLLGWGGCYDSEIGAGAGIRIEVFGFYLYMNMPDSIGVTSTSLIGGLSINVLPEMLFMSIGGGAGERRETNYGKYGDDNVHHLDSHGILELGLKFIPFSLSVERWIVRFYVLGTYRRVGEENAFTLGAGVSLGPESWYFWEQFERGK